MELKPNLKKLNQEKKEVLGKLTPQQAKIMIEKKYSEVLKEFPKANDEIRFQLNELEELIEFFDEQGIPYIFQIRCGMITSLVDELGNRSDRLLDNSIFSVSLMLGSYVDSIIKGLERINKYLGQLFFFEFQSYSVFIHQEDGKILLGEYNMKRNNFVEMLNGWIEEECCDIQEKFKEIEETKHKLPSVESIEGKEEWKLYVSCLKSYMNLKEEWDELMLDGFKKFREIHMQVAKETFFEHCSESQKEEYEMKDSEWIKYDMENFRIVHKGEENFNDVSDYDIHLKMEEFFDYTDCFYCTYKDERDLICCGEDVEDDWNRKMCDERCDCKCGFCEDNPNNDGKGCFGCSEDGCSQ